MQKYMSCKGACLASMGPDQPAEVVDDAPKNLVCKFGPLGPEWSQGNNCEGLDIHYKSGFLYSKNK